ncbi:MAG: AcrR family transcriptional regulator [Cyclobacteriaceae bacterium]|jgi:AcrR family transcriptional regulator
MTTKEKIIETSVDLFNARGYEVVTLAEIAETLKMSRGNLAYHFREKELILDEIANQIQADIDHAMKDRREFPAFSNLQVDIKSYHRLQQQYAFVFANRSVLQHDSLRRVMNRWAERTIQNNIEAFAFAVEKDNMVPEVYPGSYHNLAVNTWMIIYFWLSQKDVRNDSSLDDAEKMVWSTIIPHFTPKGIEALEKYFGPGYSQSLGRSFEETLQKIWSF